MPSLRDMTEHVTQDDIIYFVVTVDSLAPKADGGAV